MITMVTQNNPHIIQPIVCDICDYNCYKQSLMKQHCLTAKHIHLQKMMTNDDEIYISQLNSHKCLCGKEYKYRQGLFTHKKKCPLINQQVPVMEEGITLETKEKELINAVPMMDMSVIISILQKNQEFQDMMIEQNKIIVDQNKQLFELASKSGNNTNNSHNNTTNNNQQFNLNIFLNEKCKDAMNITDFAENIKVKLTDLEAFGTHGYCEGITRVFVRSLNEMDICKRPIHCSDLKREIMYVKDKNIWEKDDDRKLMVKAIDKIERKNHLIIPAWQVANPEFNQYDSKVNDVYNKLLFEAMGGETKEETVKNNIKIVRSVAKETIIPKTHC